MKVSKRALLALVLASGALASGPGPAAAATTGGLRQLAGAAGCIVDEASPPAGCVDVRGMTDVRQIAISPDGKNVYVTSRGRGALAVFDRDASTGALTQKTGALGCYTSNTTVATEDICTLVGGSTAAMGGVAVSPDGNHVYAGGSGQLMHFTRTSAGDLAYVESGTTNGGVIVNVAVSPDGASVYTAAINEPGGLIFAYQVQAGSPGLNYRACFASATTGYGCTLINDGYVDSPGQMLVTPDNKQLIVSNGWDTSTDYGSGSVVGFDRVTSGATQGDLTSPTSASCIADTLANCQTHAGFSYIRGVASADNGTKIFLAGYYGLFSVQRDPATNALSPLTSPGSCASYVGGSYGCGPLAPGVPQNDVLPVRDLTVPADGENVYVGTESAVPSIFALGRGGDGSTFPIPAPLGCLNTDATASCGTFNGGGVTQSIVSSPQGRNLYVGGGNRLFSFARDRPPACQNVSAGGAFNSTISVGLQCSDPDGDPVTYEIVTQPANGALGGVQGDHVNYGPLVGTSGTDTFTYRATAAGVQSDPATATVTVAGPLPPPRDTTKPKASVSIPKQKLRKVAKSGKLLVKVTTNEAGSIVGQAVLAAKLAKKLGLPANGQVFASAAKAKPAIVAKGKASASKPGKYTLKLKLTSKARKKVKKLKKVQLSVRVRVFDKAGNRRLVKKTATLKH
jgi:hypothetical protein